MSQPWSESNEKKREYNATGVAENQEINSASKIFSKFVDNIIFRARKQSRSPDDLINLRLQLFAKPREKSNVCVRKSIRSVFLKMCIISLISPREGEKADCNGMFWPMQVVDVTWAVANHLFRTHRATVGNFVWESKFSFLNNIKFSTIQKKTNRARTPEKMIPDSRSDVYDLPQPKHTVTISFFALYSEKSRKLHKFSRKRNGWIFLLTHPIFRVVLQTAIMKLAIRI